MISYAKEEIDRCNQADRKIKQQNTCFLNPVLTVEEGGVLGGKQSGSMNCMKKASV